MNMGSYRYLVGEGQGSYKYAPHNEELSKQCANSTPVERLKQYNQSKMREDSLCKLLNTANIPFEEEK